MLTYYDFNAVYSRNATYMFIIGARGLGKTYGAKYKAVSRALSHGEQFIYLRRYKTELKNRRSFFADIADRWPDYEFRVEGSEAQAKKASDPDAKFETIGYFIALSTAQQNKSVAYPLVKTIIFDEFIIEKGAVQYLPDEARVFNDFYSTVDRWQDKTRVLFLANGLSIMNPYFVKYGIEPGDDEWITKAGGFIVVHLPDSKQFQSEVAKTNFGAFIIETDPEYGEYAIESKFKDNDGNLLAAKPSSMFYAFTLETKHGTFSVWASSPHFHIQAKRPKAERVYTLIPAHVDEGRMLLSFSDKLLQYVRSSWRNGRCTFDTASTRNAMIDIFQR